jgi:hypothetical protein
MSTKDNQRKIYRLIFVCVFVLISFFSFVFPRHDRSWFGDFSHDFIGDVILTVSYFDVCKGSRSNCDAVFIGAPYAPKKLNINGTIVSAKDFRRKKYFKGGYDPSKNKSYEALNKWNEKNPKNLLYYPKQLIDKKKLNKANIMLNYLLFIISLGLIWSYRNFSITIVNSLASIVSKGWKKL